LRLLFICDLNSIHSKKWVGHFARGAHDVRIYSTTPFTGEFEGRIVKSAPARAQLPHPAHSNYIPKLLKSGVAWPAVVLAEKAFLLKKFLTIRRDAFHQVKYASKCAREFKPDLVHCLRIPNEGFIGMLLGNESPLVISTWGNDLMYWARKILFTELTRQTLMRADLLFVDCKRDGELARRYGYGKEKRYMVMPGAGGLSEKEIEIGRSALGSRSDALKDEYSIKQRPIFLSLRGFGSQDIDNVPLIMACRRLVERNVSFSLVIAGKRNGFRYFKLARLVERLHLGDIVSLIDEMPHDSALAALRSADFSISISRNDGTPNSMLEAMTFGSIPLMSNIESIREWITDGVNGYLFDPGSPESVAGAMQRAIASAHDHNRMREFNLRQIAERGNYPKNMSEAESELISLVGNR